MNSKIPAVRKINMILISMGIALMILIAATLISLTTENDIARTLKVVNDSIRWSQEIAENSINRSAGQTEMKVQNSLDRLDEHVQSSRERFENILK